MKTAKYFNNNVILFLAECVVLSFLCQILQLNSVVNILYIATLFVVFGCYVCSGYFTKITFINTVVIGFAFMLNGVRYNVADYYTHVLISLCIYMCLDVSAYVKLSIDLFKKISYMFLGASIILLAAYYFGPLKTSYFEHTDSIALNFHNPNAAGLWLTCIFILLVYSSFLFKKLKRIIYLIVAIGILPIILATQSRNSFLAALFFTAGIIVSKIFRIKKVPNYVLVIITVLPIIVFVFYMFVIVKNMNFWVELLSISVIDKGLDTREALWNKVLVDFWDCFLVGNYYKYYNSQMHNSLLTVFCRFGAISTTLTCITIYRALKKLQENSSFIAVLSLGAILFTGCFEASIFVGIAGLYLMVLLVPACASIENFNIDTGIPEE